MGTVYLGIAAGSQFTGDAIQAHDLLLNQWLGDSALLRYYPSPLAPTEATVELFMLFLSRYKSEFDTFKAKSGVFARDVIWSAEALKKDACSWWDDWGSGPQVLHDFAYRVTSQPVSIGEAERFWKAYAHVHNAKRNRLN